MATDTVNEYKIWSADARKNPAHVYKQIRENDPVYRAIGPVSGNTIWILTRYDDVVAAQKDPRIIKNMRSLSKEMREKYGIAEEESTFDAINRHMLNMDPPDHTRLRTLVHKAFTPRRVRDLQPRIVDIANDLLNQMDSKDEGDLIHDFAYPLPIIVIAEMLGVDRDKRDKFREWTRAILFSGNLENSQTAIMEFVGYINDLIEARRENPTDDILSGLVHANENGDTLDHMELLSMIFLLLVAGHETTVNLIGNGTLELMRHPDQMQLLQDNPDLINSAIEEMLRYNGPVECTTTRIAGEDIDWDGHHIAYGDIILPSLMAANHDPSVFEHPETFDITRNPNPHVAFGHGIHYCLGAPLARMEGTIAINALLERFPNIQLNADVDDLEWSDQLLLRGMRTLPVAYTYK